MLRDFTELMETIGKSEELGTVEEEVEEEAADPFNAGAAEGER